MTEQDMHQNDVDCVLVDKSIAVQIIEKLTSNKLLNHDFKIKELGSQVAIPVNKPETLVMFDWFDYDNISITQLDLVKNTQRLIPAQQIVSHVRRLLEKKSIPYTTKMMDNLPKKWELYGDLAILPNDTMNSIEWRNVTTSYHDICNQIWEIIADSIRVNRLAIQAEIADDKIRSSQVKMVYGEDGEVEFSDHGVKFWLDVTKVMFSSGNVTERHRIGDINMADEIVIDAFAGIGYYTLPMLVRSKAKHVYACELNPNSITALKKGAMLNGVTENLTILEGDNLHTMANLVDTADRIHLGILPSSENTWELAVDCLKTSGGIIHIHMNVKETEINSFTEYCLQKFTDYAVTCGKYNNVELKHVEKVKWYAPHIRHIVIDISIQ